MRDDGHALPVRWSAIFAVLLVTFFELGCGGTPGEPSEEDHAHGTAVTIWSDSTELFFEYPAMIAGEEGEAWAVHVTRLADFSAIEAGSLTLAFRGPDGQVYTTTSQAPARPGIYTPAPRLPLPGTYDLVIDVDGPRLQDRLDAGSITVYESIDEAPHADEDGGGITFLKEQQWTTSFGVTTASERTIPYAIEVSGEIIPAAGRVAEVSAPVSGLAQAAANVAAPASGDRVSSGQTLVVLSPTAGESSYAEARARVERLRRETARLQRLFEAGAIAEMRLVEARHDLEVAEAALEAMGGSVDGDYTYAVRSPIAGVIHQRHFTPGQHVEIGEPLFAVVNPAEVWLRLNVPSRHADAAGTARDAVFSPEGSDVQFQAERLVSVGSVIDPQSRSLPVVLAVDNPQTRLKIGQYVRARLRLGDTRSGVAVPAEAIMNEDGQAVLYVQTGGESFERRSVVLGPSDGIHTIIANGLAAGEHVVIDGAYQVYLASLGTTEIGDHGHPH